MKRTSLLLFFLLAGCTAAQPSPADQANAAGNGKAVAEAGKPFYRDGLSGVDLSGLSAVDTERVLQILNSNSCDCGCGMTIAQCRVEDKSCPRSPGLASAVVNAIKSGKSDQEAVAAVKAMVAANAAASAPAAADAAPAVNAGDVQAVPAREINIQGDPSMGPDGAPVTVVMFSDFQCPYCNRAAPVAKQLVSDYPNDVKLVFKHYPLSFHQNAKRSAVAAVAAQKQNKFWEMHDMLFANQRALDDESLRRYAQTLGLDMASYDKAVADPATDQFVSDEMRQGNVVGVRGTPSFFVNGVASPSWDLATMKKLVDAAKAGEDVGMAAGKITAELRARQVAAQKQRPQVDYSKVYDINIAGAPVKGPSNAPVTIVEFSDYQCPYCAAAEPLISQVLQAYPNDVRLVYKHFPLSFHQNARPAAEAAVFAMKHDKFWEMHERLFQNSRQLSIDKLKSIGTEIGLDPEALEKAVSSQSSKTVIDKDIQDGHSVMVTGTPTIFVNGKRLPRRDFATFKQMIDQALGARKAGAAGQ